MSDAELERWNTRFSVSDYIDGEGRNSVWLAEQSLEVVAFDFSAVAVEKARTLAASRGVCAASCSSAWLRR